VVFQIDCEKCESELEEKRVPCSSWSGAWDLKHMNGLMVRTFGVEIERRSDRRYEKYKCGLVHGKVDWKWVDIEEGQDILSPMWRTHGSDPFLYVNSPR
jgi:hypothetical protein